MAYYNEWLRWVRRVSWGRASWLGQWCTSTNPIKPIPQQSAAALPGNLTRLREARGWSVVKLAETALISSSTIYAIERWDSSQGAPNLTLYTLLRLARALEVGVEALVEENNRS